MDILLILVVAVTIGAVVFGVMTLVTGGDPGLRPVEPDSRARPLPTDRPLVEGDIGRVTFDVVWRGYRMDQVDQTLRRMAYDTGYKSELIEVLEAEITALREGRAEDADALASTRAAALGSRPPVADGDHTVSHVAPQKSDDDPGADIAVDLDDLRPGAVRPGDMSDADPSDADPSDAEIDLDRRSGKVPGSDVSKSAS